MSIISQQILLAAKKKAMNGNLWSDAVMIVALTDNYVVIFS